MQHSLKISTTLKPHLAMRFNKAKIYRNKITPITNTELTRFLVCLGIQEIEKTIKKEQFNETQY